MSEKGREAALFLVPVTRDERAHEEPVCVAEMRAEEIEALLGAAFLTNELRSKNEGIRGLVFAGPPLRPIVQVAIGAMDDPASFLEAYQRVRERRQGAYWPDALPRGVEVREERPIRFWMEVERWGAEWLLTLEKDGPLYHSAFLPTDEIIRAYRVLAEGAGGAELLHRFRALSSWDLDEAFVLLKARAESISASLEVEEWVSILSSWKASIRLEAISLLGRGRG